MAPNYILTVHISRFLLQTQFIITGDDVYTPRLFNTSGDVGGQKMTYGLESACTVCIQVIEA